MLVKPIQTRNLKLVPQTREEVRTQIVQMQPEEMAQVSSAWLARLDTSGPADPWVHGFLLVGRTDERPVGKCGFKGAPGPDRVVEIAYGINPEQQGKGYATEAAEALTEYAFSTGEVTIVRAHTLPEPNASTRVLTKCGFEKIGEVIDPEDGLVWRWERRRAAGHDKL